MYVDDPAQHVTQTEGLSKKHPIQGTTRTEAEVNRLDQELSIERSQEVKSAIGHGSNQWSSYPQTSIASPKHVSSYKTKLTR